MEGFLPLVEAFLAFALTMVGLTTAVSALVGIFQRIGRSRARGLQRMIIYLHRNKVASLIRRLDAETSFSERSQRRDKFIVDMTFAPMEVRPVDGGEPDPREWYAKFAQKADTRVEELWRWIPRWLYSSRRGVDTLTTEEFDARLATSSFGIELQSKRPVAAAAELASLRDAFNALGASAGERFQRESRLWSVLIGFLLAFGVNIDSLHLLDAYLTSPKIREQVIAQSDKILRPSVAHAGTAKEAAPEARLERAKSVVAALENQVDPATLEKLKSTIDDVDAARQEITDSARQVEAVATGISQTFPVGWTLYPNCSEPIDPRCLRVKREGTATVWPEPYGSIPVSRDVWEHDGPGLLQWFAGVLVTAVLLGLGTPFWVEVVNSFLRARNLIRGSGTQGQREKAPEGSAATTPSTS